MTVKGLMLLVIVTLVRCDCDPDTVEATFGDFQTCSRGQVKTSLSQQASCSPRPVVVRLPWPNTTLVGGGVQQMTPTHVSVLQCGGGCHRGSQGCLAVATRRREVEVMVGKCGVSVGKCEKECAVVSVTEDTECGCGCEVSLVECEAGGLHTFLPQLCQCQCRDHRAKQQCLQQGRAWNQKHCTCGCPAVLTCTSGTTYSTTTCMCEPDISNDITEEDRAPRSNSGFILSAEIIIIGVLLCLVLIMLMIIFTLINKLQSVKRRIKLKKLTAEAENNVDIYSELGKKDEMLKPKDQSYAQLYCDSPSSGFASRSGSAKYSEPEESSPEPCQECLYQSAESVRLNKRLPGVEPPCSSPAVQRTLERRGGLPPASPAPRGHISHYGQLRVSADRQGFSTSVTQQIDEAVRLLENSAAQL